MTIEKLKNIKLESESFYLRLLRSSDLNNHRRLLTELILGLTDIRIATLTRANHRKKKCN